MVRDSKFAGTFTKREIDRAIRTVENGRGDDRYVRRDATDGLDGGTRRSESSRAKR